MSKILVVVVLYRQSLEQSAAWQSLKDSEQLFEGGIFVYDNSPNEHSTSEKVHYVHDPHNSGLSKAYNTAAQYAKEHDFEWILLTDQDTQFPKGTIEQYRLAISEYPQEKLFAPRLLLADDSSFSPVRYKHKRGYGVSLASGKYHLSQYAPVNSGMCINVAAFWQAGGYNEAVRLDFSDFQFIERFVKVCPYFYLINLEARQSFSNEEKDVEKLHRRFLLFLEGAKNCRRKNMFDAICYFYVTFRHTIALTVKNKTVLFLKTYFNHYLLKT